ncbi:unnamed protein product [Enterobius vermicularis]|uniref:Integrase catalytic domain-containing protein n=1 Tax=Enterobius vermicularis TaxID=51028 RepID=A0A0N4VDF7_ENTVE|nr:unnamed protein product [Enterobius vermicularis]
MDTLKTKIISQITVILIKILDRRYLMTVKNLEKKLRYVPSEDNPADMGLRRCTPNELKTNDLRWSSPDCKYKPSKVKGRREKINAFLNYINQSIKEEVNRLFDLKPIDADNSTYKKVIIFKAEIALFPCFTTRAIHLELAEDLTTPTLEHIIQRFIAVKGKPESITSNNAPQFIALAKNYNIK